MARDYSHFFSFLVVVICSDLVLLQDKKFLAFVKVYAQDAKKFDKDFTAAFQKLEELGTSGLTPTEWA
jgi:cytochrome c peroxidase